jgi:hypothetical protein
MDAMLGPKPHGAIAEDPLPEKMAGDTETVKRPADSPIVTPRQKVEAVTAALPWDWQVAFAPITDPATCKNT